MLRQSLFLHKRWGKLVSGRLESYRAYTEIWLKIIMLSMMNWYSWIKLLLNNECCLEDMRHLRQKFTAVVMRYYFWKWLWSSTWDLQIIRETGFCIENMNLINSDNVMAKMQVRSKEFKVTMKRVMRKLINKIDYVKII